MNKVLLFAFSALLVLNFSYAATNSSADKDTHTGDIVFPDIKLSIEDESEVPLKTYTNDILKEEGTNAPRVDLDELSRSKMEELINLKMGEKLKEELSDEKKKENVSLSTVRVFYGFYGNFLADLVIGKRVGDLNYLLSYLRNSRQSTGFLTNTYYNTELQADDLNADFIFSFLDKWELDTGVGYYLRDSGLHNSPVNLSESKMFVPVNLKLSCNIDIVSTLKLLARYDYLSLTHKTAGSYLQKGGWNGSGGLDYEGNWSKDNFLKASALYEYFSFDTNSYHSGSAFFSVRFPVIAPIAVQLGAGAGVSTFQEFFWYPEALLFYKHSTVFSVSLGVTGSRERLSVSRYLNENQVDPGAFQPDEKWTYIFSTVFSPVQFLTVKLNADIDACKSYNGYAYDPAQDLYRLAVITNINILTAEAVLELMPAESLVFSGTYRYRLADREGLLFLPAHAVSLYADFKWAEIGFEASTKFTYEDIQLFMPGSYAAGRLLWDVNLSQSLNREFFVELQIRNILNQEYAERPDIPSGGISASGGIRILL